MGNRLMWNDAGVGKYICLKSVMSFYGTHDTPHDIFMVILQAVKA